MKIQKDTLVLNVKDHSVSKESFALYRDDNLNLLVTSPQPDTANLPKYYESEDYISHTDGKRSLFEKAYHFVKALALKNKLVLINSQKTSDRILLDIGAGTGDFLITAQSDGWQATGIEPSEKARTIAIEKSVTFAENLKSLPNHSFDIITMWHVLEHVPNLEDQIKELKRLLKPDGTIIIAVPNFNSFDAKHYGEFWAAYDVPRHLWHFSKTAISKLFQNEGMQLVKVLPMKFDAFYVSLLSEKYKSGKMNFARAFAVGLKSNWKGAKSGEYSSHIYIIKTPKLIN